MFGLSLALLVVLVATTLISKMDVSAKFVIVAVLVIGAMLVTPDGQAALQQGWTWAVAHKGGL